MGRGMLDCLTIERPASFLRTSVRRVPILVLPHNSSGDLGLTLRETNTQSPISQDERVVFFPTAAHRSAGGAEWIVPIHGWIFAPREASRKRAVLLGAIRMALGLEKDAEKTCIFKRRASAFLVNNERNQRIALVLGGDVYSLPPSAANGHFQAELRLSADRFLREAVAGELSYRAVTRPGDEREFSGTAFLLGDTGVSVVSDIDDTIRISEVRNRKTLMRRIFLQEFEAIPGMVRLYANWHSRGVAFHYVSAATWQLYEPLSDFLAGTGFPKGTFNMKRFRFKDRTVANLWADADRLKRKAIEPLLMRFPQRQFVLVGDSGERDPEIYRAIARAHPRQIIAIFIRNVPGDPSPDDRYQAAFGGLPPDLWRLFDDPSVIQDWNWPRAEK